ncbi:DUF6262 family protein [Marinomonas algarum]|uniref:DUF6262 family protein n=1 Tax=Marinomonas algarum TaxID=2883105 RepID=A0A9X1IL91_9GAMM|nr:DUF6262 family protein [Marinomonas algarum]MCB5160341.1 DUF6262 family protein [Marinomonas algarum]
MSKISAAVTYKKDDSKKKIDRVMSELKRYKAMKSAVKVSDLAFKCNVSKSFIYKNESIVKYIKEINKDSDTKAISFITRKEQKAISSIKSKYDSIKNECIVLKKELSNIKEENKRLREYIEELQSNKAIRSVK